MKVVELHRKEPDAEIVAWLREALSEAERGEITGLVCVTSGPDGIGTFESVPPEVFGDFYLNLHSISGGILAAATE